MPNGEFPRSTGDAVDISEGIKSKESRSWMKGPFLQNLHADTTERFDFSTAFGEGHRLISV
jgi:hypothetical protein